MATTTINDSGQEDYGFDQDRQMYAIGDPPPGAAGPLRFAMFTSNIFDQFKHFAHPQIAAVMGQTVALCNPRIILAFVSAWDKHDLTVCRECIRLGHEFVDNISRNR
jgi:hypothetical protein